MSDLDSDNDDLFNVPTYYGYDRGEYYAKNYSGASDLTDLTNLTDITKNIHTNAARDTELNDSEINALLSNTAEKINCEPDKLFDIDAATKLIESLRPKKLTKILAPYDDCPRTQKSIQYVSMKSQLDLETKVDSLRGVIIGVAEFNCEMSQDMKDLSTEVADMRQIILTQQTMINDLRAVINNITKTVARIDNNVEKLTADDSM